MAEDAAQSMRQQLCMCEDLMSAQGGSVRLRAEQQRQVCAVELLFKAGQGATILVIDDNTKMLQLVQSGI